MAKVKGPLLGLGARKRLGPAVTFRQRGSTTIAQRRTVPTDAKSPAQLPQRQLFSTILPWWHALLPPSRETYRLIDPAINQNAAYINFMRYQLMNQLVDHHTQHQKGGADQTPVQTLDSATVGPSAKPLLNYVPHPTPELAVIKTNTSTYPWEDTDISAHIPPSAIAIHAQLYFWDSGSATASTTLDIRNQSPSHYFRTIGPHRNNLLLSHSVIILLATPQTISHKLTASGANTANAQIYILAHFEPAEA